MSKYIVISEMDGIDTKLPNALYDIADKEERMDEYDTEQLYDDFEGCVVINSCIEAESEEEARSIAIKELEEGGYSSHNIDLTAIKLA